MSMKKTEGIHQPAPQEKYSSPHITIAKTGLKSVQKFTYLRCTISLDASVAKEIVNLQRQTKYLADCTSTCGTTSILRSSQKSVYRAIVLMTFLYGSESWVPYCYYLRLLECFHQCCPYIIFNINIEGLEQAKGTSLEGILLNICLYRVKYVDSMKDHCRPKIIMYGELYTKHYKGYQGNITRTA